MQKIHTLSKNMGLAEKLKETFWQFEYTVTHWFVDILELWV